MNWLKDFVKPRMNALVKRKENPSDLWSKCTCGQLLYNKDLEEDFYVCSSCDKHLHMNFNARFKFLFDDEKFELVEIDIKNNDPLRFKDLKKYTDRLKESQKKTNQQDAAFVATGNIGGTLSCVFILDFNFMGGSMGQYVGEAFKIGCLKAIDLKCPFIAVSSSGGARMQEGLVSLMQLPKTVAAINLLNDKNIPYISLLTNPTTGGVSASFAMLGDIIIAEKGAMIGFAGKRVIEETIKEKLPEDFQTAEYLLEHGMLDIVVHRKELPDKLAQVLSHLRK
ncbi:MAG: acetyl-CoA carboxylase, carboxyltransferase subunit beta [Alphaproteobacteria bacterium]|jgi:acetyl-CoA carboxylase carboxyl transferase subunit beta|nr:acetyl-CoA carboxylase, carboxyltransferase subunit beta [Alphaproteobacteria bacterium]